MTSMAGKMVLYVASLFRSFSMFLRLLYILALRAAVFFAAAERARTIQKQAGWAPRTTTGARCFGLCAALAGRGASKVPVILHVVRVCVAYTTRLTSRREHPKAKAKPQYQAKSDML